MTLNRLVFQEKDQCWPLNSLSGEIYNLILLQSKPSRVFQTYESTLSNLVINFHVSGSLVPGFSFKSFSSWALLIYVYMYAKPTHEDFSVKD